MIIRVVLENIYTGMEAVYSDVTPHSTPEFMEAAHIVISLVLLLQIICTLMVHVMLRVHPITSNVLKGGETSVITHALQDSMLFGIIPVKPAVLHHC